uniref:Endonuclease/exonuclease/phosphatase domain-containing protein n=1 Tax=Aegilops tauschii subsp. strangulata TaxID=200361 RepID=A0A453MYM0_AEGTS
MVAFRDTLEICGLIDLGFVGVPFTYDNKRSGGSNVKVRLDRAVATNSWRNLFAHTSVLHIPSPCSDHVAVLVKGSADQGPTGPKCRRFELFWERDAMLPDVIKEAWEAIGIVQNLGQLRDALTKTMVTLGSWSKKIGNVTRELAKSRSQLEELMHMNADQQDIRLVTDKMNELLYQEEMM